MDKTNDIDTIFYIGKRLITIKSSAFSSCTFTNFIIPNTVIEIQSSAFSFCYELETIIIGKSVENIGNQAFAYCVSLKCIYFYSETSPAIGSVCFQYVPTKYVMVNETYISEGFGELKTTKGTIDECLPPTLTFTQSNTF